MAGKKAASKQPANKKPTLLERAQAAVKKRTDRSRQEVTDAKRRNVDAAVDGKPRKKKR